MAYPTPVDLGVLGVPALVYGTAWKEDATKTLVEQAITLGFRGIDTANQRKHYFEEAVGQALAGLFAAGTVRRDDLFLQTKYTFLTGQDHRLPYDPMDPVPAQVTQSFASSLVHLGVDRLDSYVLHGPWARAGLHEPDLNAWRAMEAVHASGQARFLGVSNVSIGQLRDLVAWAEVRPTFVQNRCYAATGWDAEVRAFCRDEQIVYQGFSLLTANPQALNSGVVRAAAARLGATPAQVVFAYARAVGMQPLTGSRDPTHLRQDLAATALDLTPDEVRAIDRVAI